MQQECIPIRCILTTALTATRCLWSEGVCLRWLGVPLEYTFLPLVYFPLPLVYTPPLVYTHTFSVHPTASLLAFTALLDVQSSTWTRIHSAILVIDTSNNASYNQVHWLVGTPYLAVKASNDGVHPQLWCAPSPLVYTTSSGVHPPPLVYTLPHHLSCTATVDSQILVKKTPFPCGRSVIINPR